METVQDNGEVDAKPKKRRQYAGKISWRMILVRLLVNALTLLLVAVLVPNIYFVEPPLGTLLIMAFALGLLNAFVKPIVQFLTLPFVFATYGFALVVINTILLLLLALIFDEVFYVGSLVAALFGGLVMGIVSSLLESLLGLDLPIANTVPETGKPPPVSQTIERKLVDRMADDTREQSSLDEETTEPIQAENSDEPPTAAVVAEGEDDSAPASDAAPGPIEEDANGSTVDIEGEQPGDAK